MKDDPEQNKNPLIKFLDQQRERLLKFSSSVISISMLWKLQWRPSSRPHYLGFLLSCYSPMLYMCACECIIRIYHTLFKRWLPLRALLPVRIFSTLPLKRCIKNLEDYSLNRITFRYDATY